MNVAGHVAVARRLHPDAPAIWLGAALPDLAAMGRFRLLGSTEDVAVTSGIRLHHATDDAFHRHPIFTDVMARLRRELAQDGIDRGPARAIAHVGPELMIDGFVLADRSVADDLGSTMNAIPTLANRLGSLVSDEHRERWHDHLDRLAGRLPPDDHGPDAVAGRLQRILSRRPRISFPERAVATVAERLRGVHDDLERSVEPLIDDLVEDLAGTVSSSTRR